MPAASVSCGLNARVLAHACTEWPSRWWPGTWPSFCQAKLSAKCSATSCEYEISQAKEFASGSTAYVLPTNADNSCAPAHEIPVTASTAPATKRLTRTGQARIADGSGKQGEAQQDISRGEGAGNTCFGPGARRALGEVGEDQQARPLIGVSLSGKNSAQGKRQRKGLEREPRAAGSQRREPQLPRQAQGNEGEQRYERDGLGGAGHEAGFGSSPGSSGVSFMIRSAMATHSLQMNAFAPATSFFTSSWCLPQNEQRSLPIMRRP